MTPQRTTSEATTRPDTSPLRTLRGHWLLLARVAWVAVVMLGLGLFVASLPVYYEQLMSLSHPSQFAGVTRDPEAMRAGLEHLGIPVGLYAAYDIGLQVLSVLVFVAVGAAIFWRRSSHPVAFFVSLTLILVGTTLPNSLNALKVSPTWAWLINTLGDLGFGLFFILFYIFPDGRFVPRWTRWLATVFVALLVGSNLFPGSPVDPNVWPVLLEFALIPILFGSLLYSQVYRYLRVSRPVERQQTKWAVFGLVAAVVAILAIGVPGDHLLARTSGAGMVLYEMVAQIGMILATLLIPLSIGISILKYRLYEIDVVINRTLVYGFLTVMLVLIYVGLVVGLQYAVRALTGQESPLAIVASTLVIAALFNPLRRHIQSFIDRRFYRRKYDAAKTLEAFSAKLRNETDLDALSDELLSVVRETMQPAPVSLWLRPDTSLKEGGRERDAEANLRREGIGDRTELTYMLA